jgi:uncharacterized phage protein gp47/JayE
MTTYPLPTLACTVGPTGISSPSYADILLSLQASYTAIYGSDVVLDNSTQDGQWTAIQAQAIYDSNQVAIFVYNQFSPATAVGTGLSSVVKINGIAREVSSDSTAPVLFTGQNGTQLINPIVGDNLNLGTQWQFLGTIDIPGAGSVTQSVTCTTPGAVTAAAGSLTEMITPTAGWQSATNPEAATAGAPVELDAVLRQRQAVSTDLPAQTILTSMIGNLLNLGGVLAVAAYENPNGTTDVNGLPPHSIALVVEGGDAQDIANTIGKSRGEGVATFGNTSETYIDPYGIPQVINFSFPVQETIDVSVNISPLTGYSTAIGGEIQQSLSNYITSLGIGTSVINSRLVAPALLRGPSAVAASPTDPDTFELTIPLLATITGGTLSSADIPIAFNQLAVPGTITVIA